MEARKMKANIGLEENSKETIRDVLNRVLADEFLLYTKTRNYHWNVTGPHFNDLHKFFEEQYGKLDEFVDDVAERVRMLGERPLASMKEYLEVSGLKENTSQVSHSEMIKDLLADHEKIIRNLREDIEKVEENGDVANGDFLTGMLEEHEKMAWMLRSMAE